MDNVNWYILCCMRAGHLVLPSLVNNTATICLPLLEDHLVPPLGHVDSIHPSARLDAEARPGTPGGHAIYSGHIDGFARVELEGRLRAVHLEVDLAIRVVGGDEFLEGGGAAVDGDGCGLVAQDETVIDVGLGGAEGEWFVTALEFGVWGRSRGGDSGGVDGEVRVGDDLDLCTLDGGTTSQVKVAIV